MNIFSFIGDLLHLASILIILLKIYTQQNCRGISLKTQILYLTVFACRYVDIFWNFSSLYNWVMKIVFLTTSSFVVFVMTMNPTIKKTYGAKEDSVNVLYLLLPCLLLSLLLTENYHVAEVLWTMSILLESVAIIPQLVVVHQSAADRNGFVENLTSHYVFTLGGYRAMYLFNWIYRVMTEAVYHSNWLVWSAGVLQTAIYCDFFYYYLTAQVKGETMSLPI